MSEEKPDGGQPPRLIITPEEFGRDLYHKVWDQVIGPGINKANLALRTARAKPPSRLLHFTSAVGLEAIVRTGILRLCRARASNDPLELEYGLEIARGIIRELPGETPLEHAFKRVMEAGTRGGFFAGKDRRPPEPAHLLLRCSDGRPDADGGEHGALGDVRSERRRVRPRLRWRRAEPAAPRRLLPGLIRPGRPSGRSWST